MSPKGLLRALQSGPWGNTKVGTQETVPEMTAPQQSHRVDVAPGGCHLVSLAIHSQLPKALHHPKDLVRECRRPSTLKSQDFRPRTQLCVQSHQSRASRGRCSLRQTLQSGAPSTVPFSSGTYDSRLVPPLQPPLGQRDHFLFFKPVLHRLFVPVLMRSLCLLICLFSLFRVSRK